MQHLENKTICIVQITRFGDLLQTYQAAKVFKEIHPEINLILVARKQFASPLNFLLKNVFSTIHEFELGDFFNLFDGAGLIPARNCLKKFIAEIQTTPIDVLVNLSWSKSSSHLCSLINATHKLGPFTNLEGKDSILDNWSSFVYSNVMGGRLNPFSLVDIYRSILGSKNITPKLNQTEKQNQSSKILIHPFASTSEKTWNTAIWSEIILYLLKRYENIEISILGSKEDSQNFEKITNSPFLTSFKEKINGILGQNLETVFEGFNDCRLFIGHDSMLGHMASIQKVQTMTFSIGSVRPHETTPYGTGNYTICPKEKELTNAALGKQIPIQIICQSISQVLENGVVNYTDLKKSISPFILDRANIYESNIDNNGFQTLNEISGDCHTIDLYRDFFQIIWSYYLEGKELNLPFPTLGEKTIQNITAHKKGVEQLYELTDFGLKYTKFILDESFKSSPNLNVLKEFSNRLIEIDNLQILVKQGYPVLAPLIDFFVVKKANLIGEDIQQMAVNCYTLFEDYQNLTSALYELIESTIKSQSKTTIQNNISKD